MKKRILLLTPPLLQTNTPYPATMHLAGFLKSRGFKVFQRDLTSSRSGFATTSIPTSASRATPSTSAAQ